ncbi:MAG: hypothetical protein WBN64_10890 [Candidatus Deferrimicrobium sp.]
MIKKSMFLTLAVGVLMGTMAVSALAMGHAMGDFVYGPADSGYYFPTDVGKSEANPGTSESHADVWKMSEPIETGALPDRPKSSSDAGVAAGSMNP